MSVEILLLRQSCIVSLILDLLSNKLEHVYSAALYRASRRLSYYGLNHLMKEKKPRIEVYVYIYLR